MLIVRTYVLCVLAMALTACTTSTVPPPSRLSVTRGVEARSAELLGRMTLEEKVGQIIQADIAAVTPDEIRQYNLGSVLNGGNSAPGGGKVAPVSEWIALADKYWTASTDKSDGGVGIPILWGTDAVHGHNNLQAATIFPHNIGLGAANDTELIGRIAAITAKEIRATGIEWTFAPTLAVAQDDRWGRTYESYSENPDIVARYSKAMVEGLQGKSGTQDFLKGSHVISTAKHFIGDGGTQFGIDKGDSQGDLETIIKLHGAGYAPAIAADVQTVMASFSSVNGKKMHGYRELLTDFLRGKLGFKGFVVGDWDGHAEIPGCTKTDCAAALEAGLDMYMAPESWKGLYVSLLEQAKSGELDLSRLDEAVTRILNVKIRSGLLDAPAPSQRAGTKQNQLGSPDHKAVGREAVRKSLVLLKNNNGALPLKASQNILVAGSGADSIQQQTGGWTLSWQGDKNSNEEFASATTIFGGIRDAVTAAGGTATLSTNGKFELRPDVAIVVFGEQPYAEYRGDRSDLVFENKDGENLALLKSLKLQGIPVVTVFLSGRPMWINPHLNASDAFVAAWLPGTEGGGVADVLVGDSLGKPRNDFAGRLSFSWPQKGDAAPINGPNAKGALFPLGYGLNYSTPTEIGIVSEDSGVDNISKFTGAVMIRGDAAPGLALYVGDSSNSNTPANALVSRSLGGIISTSGIDYKAQEDARMLQWNGQGVADFSVRTHNAFDLTTLNGGVLDLLVEWKIFGADEKGVTIELACGEECSGSLNATSTMRQAGQGQWMTSRFPLACFVARGFDPTKLTRAFSIKSTGKTEIAMHSVKFVPAQISKNDCSSFELLK